MARSVQTIYDELLPKVKEALGIAPSTVITTTSFEGMLTYAFAFVSNILETVYDLFKVEIETLVAQKKPQTEQWYAEIAKDFQYGYTIDDETLEYDNTGLTPEQIEASKIIQYVAVVEGVNVVRVKVATQGSADLDVLNPDQLTAFSAYMIRKKGAGVKLSIESNTADSLKAEIDVYVDPLKFNANGGDALLDGEPLRDVVIAYLKKLPFNGIFAIDFMVDELQKQDGVVFTRVKTAEWRYGALPFTSIGAFVTPDAGYLRFENPEDLVLNYIFQNPIS